VTAGGHAKGRIWDHKTPIIRSFAALACLHAPLDAQPVVFPGADERTPYYFTWINNTNEGPMASQTAANLFQWLHEEYGMALDIYNSTAR
jgi:hypothetical protein